MKSIALTETTSYMARLAKGADILDELKKLADERGIDSGFFSVIGACEKAELAFYDHVKRTYERHSIDEACEILNCTGNIFLKDGQRFIHAHATLSKKNGSAVGGHVNSMSVFAAEAYVRCFSEAVERKYDEETGLYLMELKQRA
ncbi:MAG: DNA-binding protein [Candidatus Altiarchaeota archaeon]|nr:DNA-binding protein [Candidatus Altiarchaeota archaeon]